MFSPLAIVGMAMNKWWADDMFYPSYLADDNKGVINKPSDLV